MSLPESSKEKNSGKGVGRPSLGSGSRGRGGKRRLALSPGNEAKRRPPNTVPSRMNGNTTTAVSSIQVNETVSNGPPQQGSSQKAENFDHTLTETKDSPTQHFQPSPEPAETQPKKTVSFHRQHSLESGLCLATDAHLTVSSTPGQFSDAVVSSLYMSELEDTASSNSTTKDLCPSVVLHNIKVSYLPPGVLADDLEVYFESQGEDVDVVSTDLSESDGKAYLKLVGLSNEELALLQKKRHRIKKQPIQVSISSTTCDDSLLEEEPPPMDTIVITNLPSDCDEEFISMFFQNRKRSNGTPDSIESCAIVSPGTAQVKFKSQEFAAKVMQRETHKIKGQKLHLQYKVETPEPETTVELNKLLLSNVPDVHSEHLDLFLSNQLGIDEEEFSVQRRGDAAIVTFITEYTCEELKMMIEKLTQKALSKVTIKAQLCRASNTIQISNISNPTYYNEEVIELYFESSKSGGGTVTEVKLLGNGEAVVTFQDPQVIKNVLSKQHAKFGDQSIVKELDAFQSLVGAYHTESKPITHHEKTAHGPTAQSDELLQSLPSIEVQVDPLVAKCISKQPSIVATCLKELNVTLEVFSLKITNLQPAKIKITASNLSKPGWQKEAREKVEACIATNFTVKQDLRVHKDGMQELMGFISNVSREMILEYEFAQKGKLLNVAGNKSAVSIIEEKAHEIFSKHQQSTLDVELSPEDFIFFEKVKQQQINDTFPRVTFQLNSKQHSLRLHGSVQDTTLAKAQLPKFLVHNAVDVSLDSLIVSFFSNQHGNRKLNEMISSSFCHVAPFFRSNMAMSSSLQLLCDPNDSTRVPGIVKHIRRSTDVKHLQLPESYMSVQHTISEEYDTLCARLLTQFSNMFIINHSSKTSISVAGIAENVHQCTQLLHQFIKEKSSAVLSIELDKGQWRLLSKHIRNKLDLVLSKCQSVGVEVKQPTSIEDEEPRIVLKGDRIQVEAMGHKISELRERIYKSTITIARPGTCNFLRSKSTRLAFDGLESRNHVAIEVTESIEEFKAETTAPEIEPSPHFKKMCAANLKTKQIFIYTGDITEFSKADVIVNAANVDLKHMGGVAGAISRKGGVIIQQDSDQHVRRKGRLGVGDAWLTKQVGNLPCKALVHTVGPQWTGGGSKEEALLDKACRATLRAAKAYSSIIFPAISSGIYGFPIVKCADTMVRAIVDFCNKNQMCELRDIVIILPPSKSSQVIHFVKALQKILPSDSVHADTDTVTLQPELPYFPKQLQSSPTAAFSRKPQTKKSTVTPVSVPPSILNLIKLQKGSLLDVKADVYVNTTNKNLDLSSGAVSQALLKAGGQTLQDECTQQRPIQTGEIAVTGPGSLPCKYVLHIVVPQYNGREGEKVLGDSVQKCLKKCSSLEMESIAFPAIGTGNLGYPNDAVAKTMLKAITDHMSSQKHTSIKQIHLVIFMANTYQAFQQELQGYRSGSHLTSEANAEKLSPSPDFSLPKQKPRRSYRSAPLRDDSPVAGTQVASGKGPAFTIGTLQVQVLNGDITDENTDVIVNPTNSTLKLDGQGVAGALLRKGGPELQSLCDAISANGKPLEGERVVVTKSTGNLKCKMIFHINFEGKEAKSFVKVITNCLKKAENKMYTSISFPAIGTGTHGYPPQEAAAGMMKAIEQFSASNPQHVRNIRLVLFQPSAYQEFLAKFRNPAQPGLWQRLVNYATSAPTWESVQSEESDIAYTEEEEPETNELTIIIYGENLKTVKVVETEIDSLIDENLTTEQIDDPYTDLLSPGQAYTLTKKGKQLNVRVEIDRAPINQITLKGDKADVLQMKSFVIKSFAQFEQSTSRKREAEQLYTMIKWKQMDSNVGEYFDLETNYEIEMASRKQHDTYTHQDQLQHFTIDFSKSQVTDHNTGVVQKIERCDRIKQLQEGERPKTWDPMPTDPNTGVEVPVHIVDLQPTDKEYLEVNQMFDKTMTQVVANPSSSSGAAVSPGQTPSGTKYSSIIKIQRIQNPLLYKQYISKRELVDKQNPSGSKTSERRLFHGTTQTACQDINRHNFNRSYSGKNATVYGKGVYFARDSYYSARDTYSPRDAKGHKYVYVARVISGEFTVGNSSMIDAPTKSDGTKYDSVVDNDQNPQIFVVFQDAVVYPEYLITFT